MVESTQAQGPAPLRARVGLVAAMSLANAVAFLDRQSLPLLVPQVESDLRLTDTQMSLVVGLAFVTSWALFGAPAGVLIDRFNRKLVMASGACVWGAMTVLCGFAQSFGLLAFGRLGVGLGEAVVGPGAVSFIKDGVTRDGRARALGIFALGASLGSALALLAGGAILALIRDEPTVVVPFIGVMRSWQFVLAICGLIAFPLAAILACLRDPGRATTALEGRETGGVKEALRYACARPALFAPLFLANGATVIMLVSYQIWQPTLFARVFAVSRPMIGLGLGLITLFLGVGSQFLAGALIDRLERRGVERAPILVALGLAVLALAPAILSPLAPSLPAAWAWAALYALASTGFFTTGLAALARLTPNALAGRMASFHFIWVGVLGTALGPTLIALASDAIFSGPAAISRAMASVCGALDVVALVCFVWLLRVWPRGQAGEPEAPAPFGAAI